MSPVKVSYFSDVLCVWAYVGQRRLDQLAIDFGDQIEIETHYCSVFPDAWSKIEKNWSERGGFSGFGSHINEVGEKFPHVEINPKLWQEARPRTSTSVHQFLKAVELIEAENKPAPALPFAERLSTRAAWAVRCAFFRDARDISHWDIQRDIAAKLGLDAGHVEDKLHSAEAIARLAHDDQLCADQGITGSPTYLLNQGRQKLFGNVGYRLIEANVNELLHNPSPDEASWC